MEITHEHIDLTKEQKHTVLTLLKQHVPDTEVWAYGSRVRGGAMDCSDLDMVVFASKEQMPAIYALKEAFEESNLPFRVDLLVWNHIPPNFHEAIKQEKTVLQSAKES